MLQRLRRVGAVVLGVAAELLRAAGSGAHRAALQLETAEDDAEGVSLPPVLVSARARAMVHAPESKQKPQPAARQPLKGSLADRARRARGEE